LQAKVLKIFTAVILTIISAMPFCPPAFAQQIKSTDGYKIEMDVYGPEKFIVKITESAIRVDMLKSGCTVVSSAPDWKVFVWKMKDGKMLTISRDFWMHKCRLRRFDWTGELQKAKKFKHITFMEIPALRFVYPRVEVIGVYLRSDIGREPIKDVSNHAVVVALDLPHSEQTGNTLAVLLGMRAIPAGVPVEVKRIRLHGVNFYCKTKSLQKTRIPLSDFVLPHGYKSVPYSPDFFRCDAQVENTNELFKSILR
jgi:hypothetical protein